jgi:hypothetical protein
MWSHAQPSQPQTMVVLAAAKVSGNNEVEMRRALGVQ